MGNVSRVMINLNTGLKILFVLLLKRSPNKHVSQGMERKGWAQQGCTKQRKANTAPLPSGRTDLRIEAGTTYKPTEGLRLGRDGAHARTHE